MVSVGRLISNTCHEYLGPLCKFTHASTCSVSACWLWKTEEMCRFLWTSSIFFPLQNSFKSEEKKKVVKQNKTIKMLKDFWVARSLINLWRVFASLILFDLDWSLTAKMGFDVTIYETSRWQQRSTEISCHACLSDAGNSSSTEVLSLKKQLHDHREQQQ